MKVLISIFLIAGLTFIFFLTILILGIVKKKRKIIMISFLIFTASIITGIIGIITTAKKTYDKVSDLTKTRTGSEIYASLLGKPESPCVEILNYQDQTIPRIDEAIYIHFKTCPKELERILIRKDFQFEKVSTKKIDSDNTKGNWFKPEKLGDHILVFKYYDNNGNGQEIYSSKDSTEVYLKDSAH